ncbi:kinase-like domain-containing protein [Infundibulicybe gibba]|nr:kinase-like domain-containing protein [Infundibulicybe gibba]
MRDGKLYKGEVFWRNLTPWLKEQGYVLRPRYQPDWVASWKTSGKSWIGCEDGQIRMACLIFQWHHLMDATRTSDQATVVLKRIVLTKYPHEVPIAQMFSSEPLQKDPHNRCVPVYEVLPVPGEDDIALLVMPFLIGLSQPEYETIGEVVEFFRQIFEGLCFMHSQHIAHRDCKSDNIMMDSSRLYREPVHPANIWRTRDYTKPSQFKYTRTQKPVKYYFIDFGLSRQYVATEEHPLAEPLWGGTQGLPEYETGELVNPFHVDVYCIGNIVRNFTHVSLEFMDRLVDDMMQANPNKRPTMDEVVARFEKICNGLSSWELRARLPPKDEHFVVGILCLIPHWIKQFVCILMCMPALPKPVID